ncbi:hydroxyisourate hydrolase [uncultured Tateyamaria sp.]|uniref:hydroxyisourate hydrolase n=1 Tax=uncultured Tateyamaria sp. TaxID=455651 RepID=UPI00261059B8|nr:hydroxyisourate hydrolase [uncultured Tateyamaria sp.]
MAAGYLTTHVLDTARGLPAAGIKIALYVVSGNSHRMIAEAETNADGRTDTPILPQGKFKPGQYELIFFCGDYIDAHGLNGEAVKFLDQIPIRFGISDADAHYHVPLLLSPFGYSTYRGS